MNKIFLISLTIATAMLIAIHHYWSNGDVENSLPPASIKINESFIKYAAGSFDPESMMFNSKSDFTLFYRGSDFKRILNVNVDPNNLIDCQFEEFIKMMDYAKAYVCVNHAYSLDQQSIPESIKSQLDCILSELEAMLNSLSSIQSFSK